MARKCLECGAAINACMGSVVAGDFVKAVEGKLDWKKVRERCGLCVEKKMLQYENPTQEM